MDQLRTVADWLAERDLTLDALVEQSNLDRKVVAAIVAERYTPSPQQRQRLAAVLGVPPEQIAWGHGVGVSHIHGHGPQFGRSP